MNGQRIHELKQFLEQDLAEMASEYARIKERTREDPGTAGDEGEEVWRELLENWLPEGYTVVTKGRVLGADGSASPQVDLLVLKPSYPKRLLNKKLYLAGGVAAVFECKNTLTARHLSAAFERAQAVNTLTVARFPSPYGHLVPPIPFGLLAHSHSWKSAGSRPLEIVDGAIETGMAALAKPSDPPTLICVADLACWHVVRTTYEGPGLITQETFEKLGGELANIPQEPYCQVAFYRHTQDLPPENAPVNAIAPAVTYLLDRLAHDDVAVRPLVEYFHAAGLPGRSTSVSARTFPISVFGADVQVQLPRRLTDSVPGSDWAMSFPY